MSTLAADSIPRLPPGVRLHHDRARQQWVIQAPERVIELDEIAHAIVSRCDGQHSLAQLVDALAQAYDASAEDIRSDVQALLDELLAKRVLRV